MILRDSHQARNNSDVDCCIKYLDITCRPWSISIFFFLTSKYCAINSSLEGTELKIIQKGVSHGIIQATESREEVLY